MAQSVQQLDDDVRHCFSFLMRVSPVSQIDAEAHVGLFVVEISPHVGLGTERSTPILFNKTVEVLAG